MLAASTASTTEIIAHRGASYDAPENTVPAVQLGWERGADAVEIDVHRTADGRIVAIHDKDLSRVARRPGLVAEMTLEALRTLDVGAWKGDRWKGTRIPTLEEVLETVPPGKTLVVEIKCPKTVLPELERTLARAPNGGRVTLIAFDYETISEAKRRMPETPAFWLYGFSAEDADRYGIRGPEDLLRRVRTANLDGLDLRHNGPWVGELAKSLRDIGKATYVYTVNDPVQARRLRDLGVAGLTTDRPGFLRAALESE